MGASGTTAAAAAHQASARTAAQWAGPITGAAATAVVSGYAARANGASWWEAGFAAGGGAIGSAAGSAGGAAVGAATGAQAGPAGSAVGGYVGSATGGIAGGYAGARIGASIGARTEGMAPAAGGAIKGTAWGSPFGPAGVAAGAIGGAIAGWIDPGAVTGPQVPSPTKTVEGDPPFTGGQNPNAYYSIMVDVYNSSGSFIGQAGLGSQTPLQGKITAIEPFNAYSYFWRIRMVNEDGNIRLLRGYDETFGFSSVPLNFAGELSISNIRLTAVSGGESPVNLPGPGTEIPTPMPAPRSGGPIDFPWDTRERPDIDLPSPTPGPVGAPKAPRAPAGAPTGAPRPEPPPPETLPIGDPIAAPAPAGNPTATPAGVPAPATPQNVPSGSPSPLPGAGGQTKPKPTPPPGPYDIELPLGTQIKVDENGNVVEVSAPAGVEVGNIPGATVNSDKTPLPEIDTDWMVPPLLIGGGLAIGTAIATGTITGLKVDDPTTPKKFTQIPKTPTPPKIDTPTDNPCKCNGPLLSALGGQQANNAAMQAQLARIEANQVNPLSGFGALQAGQVGILAFLQTMNQFLRKAWEMTRMQKVLDVLTFIGVMHNVSMLSRGVGETFLEVVGQGIQAIGIRDEEDNVIDVHGAVTGGIESMLRSLLGNAVYEGTAEAWNKANRIISSASMIIWTIRSISDASLDLMEWIGENTGKIGNALKRWGVVGERDYPWMSERAQVQNRMRTRFSKYTGALETAEDRISVYAQATSSVIEVQDELNELGENFGRFRESVVDGIPDPWEDNVPLKTVADEAKAAADAIPDIPVSDSQKG